MHNQDSLG